MANPLDLVNTILGEWAKTSQPLKERLGMYPLGQYQDGRIGMAWPGFATSPVEAGKRAYDSGMPLSTTDPEAAEAAYRDMGEVALGTMLGGSVASMGSGSKGALMANGVSRTPEQAAKLGQYLADRSTKSRYKHHGEQPLFKSIELRDYDVPDAVMEYADEATGKGPRRGEVRDIPIRDLIPTQGAVEFDPNYALREGFADARPIIAALSDGKYYVLDGHHRMMMQRLLGRETIPTKVEDLGSVASMGSGAARGAVGSAGGKLRLGPVDRTPFGGGQADIFDGDRLLGRVSYAVDGSVAQIDDIAVADGSNSLGVSGIKALREAFREIEPNVTRFEGGRAPGMKTGAARQGAIGAAYPKRLQQLDIAANAKSGAAVPLAADQDQDPFTQFMKELK